MFLGSKKKTNLKILKPRISKETSQYRFRSPFYVGFLFRVLYFERRKIVVVVKKVKKNFFEGKHDTVGVPYTTPKFLNSTLLSLNYILGT